MGKHFARLDGNLDNLNDTTKYFYHTDHLGSTVAVTDIAGNTIWDGEYTPFGKQVGQTGDLKCAAKFTGKELDEDIGLYYFNARWYDQEIGRFISEDPVYDPNNPNLYAYCANNPLKFTDLSGKNIDRKVEELLSRQDDDLANVDVSRREAFFVKQLYDTKEISAKDAVKILNVLKEKGKITNQDLRKLGFDAKNEAGDRITLMYKLAKFETTIKEIEHLESEQRSNDLIFALALLKGSSSTKSVTINGRKFTEKDVKALSSSVKGTRSTGQTRYAKTSFWERLTTKKVSVDKLVGNPADEFMDPKIGPSDTALSKHINYIKQYGTIDEPILVKKLTDGTYEIQNGHHRWLAAQKMGLEYVPVEVMK